MARRSKGYSSAAEKIDRENRYPLPEAMTLAKEASRAKFDETVEVSVRLGIDPRKADQNIRGTVVLPHGTGKSVRVAVFAKGDKAREAEEAGADVVGAEELVARITDEGWLEFDKAVATPDMMGVVGRIGKILGPPWSYAKSKGWDSHHGYWASSARPQRRQDRIPCRQGR